MRFASKTIVAGAAALMLGIFASAQDGPAKSSGTPEPGHQPPPQDELRGLQQAVEAQTKQIEALRQAVTQLTERLAAKDGVQGPPAPPHAEAPPPAAAAPPPTPAAADAHGETPIDANSGPQHTVAKGETLTSIAKHYKIGIADLQKANKITDDRKLQIGQVLTIPSPKPSEPSPKKENP